MKRLFLSTFALLGLVFLSPAQQKHYVGEKCCGGIVFKVESGGLHGLVAAEKDLPGKYKWREAKDECNRLNLNGFSDWRLPNKEESGIMEQNIKTIGNFSNGFHWSSTEINSSSAWAFNFYNYDFDNINFIKSTPCYVRAVRAF